MDREITVPFTPKLIRMSMFARSKGLFIYCGLLFAVFGLYAFFVLSCYDHVSASWWLSQWVVLCIPGLLFVIYYSAYRKGMAMIKTMKNPEVKYRFTDERLHAESDISTSDNAWSVFESLHKDKRVWQLKMRVNAFLVFPVDQLDDELKDFLSSKVPKPKLTFAKVSIFFLWHRACLSCLYLFSWIF